MFNYTDEMLDAITMLRTAGMAVVCFDPDELEGADPGDVEDRLVSMGWDVIEALKDETIPQAPDCPEELEHTNKGL